MPSDYEEKLETIAQLLVDKKEVLFFTGAGISVPSGIPDFRSPGGIWDKYDPSVYGSLKGFKRNPEKVWTFFRDLYEDLKDKEPNEAHYAITKIQNLLGKEHVTIVTQNIDNLHQSAGSENVLEIHGTIAKLHCLKCSFEELFQKDDHLDIKPYPKCPSCNRALKPKAILFGENLPENVFKTAIEKSASSDILIAVGTSLEVFPANNIFLEPQKPIKVLLNLEKTEYKQIIDYVVIKDVAESLPDLADKVKLLMM